MWVGSDAGYVVYEGHPMGIFYVEARERHGKVLSDCMHSLLGYGS
jgi:hypothetical protein